MYILLFLRPYSKKFLFLRIALEIESSIIIFAILMFVILRRSNLSIQVIYDATPRSNPYPNLTLPLKPQSLSKFIKFIKTFLNFVEIHHSQSNTKIFSNKITTFNMLDNLLKIGELIDGNSVKSQKNIAVV